MGKANKVKIELSDAVEMVDLVQTLKDIADNKFFTLVAKKNDFRRFGESFVEFFRMVNLSNAEHPLMSNDVPKTAVVAVTVEGSFLGEFNNKIIRMANKQKEIYDEVEYIAVGEKSIEPFKSKTPNIKSFVNYEAKGLYESSLEIKDYLVDRVMKGEIGKVVVIYGWPKDFDTQKTKVFKLLPCDELISKQAAFVSEFEKIIEESEPKDIIGLLADLWITTRIYEILIDSIIAASAAQSKFLDESLDKMKKERDKTKVRYRKAKKGDIDKSLRETFSARLMTNK